ncbi:hypothetical protein [Paenibacillus kribbensis]|uniref:Uncharacterized protein n=1 Tax=Paenibacillus kribbensis TaxID=172713 RepID=A0A222WP13_9BACL|nr:hypothetical protein [Paenibacillus kribbensis]ASR48209.1 hypothetical protein B4V02_16635 [Paenibacillus kribbensis]
MNDAKQCLTETVVLAQNVKAAPIYTDAKGTDFDGIRRVSLSLAKDIELVTRFAQADYRQEAAKRDGGHRRLRRT